MNKRDRIVLRKIIEETAMLKQMLDGINGISQQTVRAVSENCQTLRVKDFGFDE
jgi:hypothetical protein